ncbi:hypothetical protein JR338_06155 [Chloroflexota bacterium]|nr:hypothetical protein JR338_06155 [Chloroflexota bacterium]
MFKKNQIEELVELLQKRDVKLYHSAQYKDFKSYLHIGGIPSRALLEKEKQNMTKFVTDQNDKDNGVWDKVFLNLEDFGKIFAKGHAGVPTVYGPITFIFSPAVLKKAEDVAICLRSAGCMGFDRRVESLNQMKEVDSLFSREFQDDYHFQYLNPILKTKVELKATFNLPSASSPELSLTFSGQYADFDESLIGVLVDPYQINESKLVDLVREDLYRANIQIESKQRWWGDRWYMMPEIVEIIQNEVPTLDELMNKENLSARFTSWINRLKDNELDYQWQNYATYLREGTIIPIVS